MNKQVSVIFFTVLYIFGIIAFLYNLIIQFSIVLFIISCYFLFFKKSIRTKFIFIFLFAFILGLFNTLFNTKQDDSLTSYADNEITASAKVITIPTNSTKDRTKFYAKIKNAKLGDKIIDTKEDKILITINDLSDKISNIKIGDTIEVKGRLKIPQYAQNPSQFDYSKYLQYKKTFSLLYINADWKIIQRANDAVGKILSRLNDTRERILKIHSQNVKSPMLEILGGIIFGDDAVNPDEEIKEMFINSGIFHILAASGMNVTLIFGIWFFFALRLKLEYKFSILTGIALIVFYTFMTGFGPPIIRAALMLTLVLIGKLINRNTETMSLLFFVGFLMLLFNPLMLFDVGFQLSFIVTFALILTSPIISLNFKCKWINNIIGACSIPVIAQLYAAPLQIFYFNTFTLYSVFANIAIIPVLSIVSFLGFISSILALIPAISVKICYFADFILNPLLIYIVKTAEFFAGLPDAIIFLKKPMLIQILLYYLIIISLTIIVRYEYINKKIRIIITSVFIIFLMTFINIPDKNPEIIYFSVGNADSFLIKSPDNKYFMIDTAKSGYKGSSPTAKNVMVKYMKDKGINNLYALILSHFDADHAGGTVEIMKNINVKTFYITDVYENTIISDEIQNYVKNNNLKEEVIAKTKEIYNKDNFIITLLKPQSELIKDENQKSLIVHLKYRNQNLLFMGDGDINSYNALPERYKTNIKVMKSGHHGANNTVNKDMAENSEIFILSTGFNVYNHPHSNTIKIIKDNGKHYLRTDNNNAIKVILKPNKTIVKQYSPKYKKYERVSF